MKMIFTGIFFALSTLGLSASAAVNPCADVPHSQVQYDAGSHAFTGCKIMAIDTASLYSDLGIQVGDVLQPDPPTKLKAKEMEAILVNEDRTTE